MRERLQTLLPSVLALALVSLLAGPIAASASSGLPATITMYPEVAVPGDTVEVTGLDFPGDATVALQLTTSAGTVPLADIATSSSGDFREVVPLPVGVPEGFWTVQAIAPDGSTATYAFAAGGAAAAAALLDETAAAASSGNSASDIMVMLLLGVVLGGIFIGGMFAYRILKDDGSQPGMGAGDDLIWGGGSADATPQTTATEEPYWKAAQSET